MHVKQLAAVMIVLVAAAAWAADGQALPLLDGRDGYEPAAAWGGDVFLVVWKSGHLGPGDLREKFDYVGDIVGCRLDASGKVLDEKPFVVCGAKDLQEHPRLAFDGKNFLAVWHDYRNEKDWDIYAARVTPEGKVLDPDGIAVSKGAHSRALPDAAWDGKTFQVVWQDFRSGARYEVYGTRVGSDGRVMDAQGKLLVTEKAPHSRFGPVVAGDVSAGRSLLFWIGTFNGKTMPGGGCQLVKDGAAGAPTFTTSGAREAIPHGNSHANFPLSLAAGPEVYLGAWTTHVPLGRGNAQNSAHAAVFDKDGKLKKKFLLFGKGGVGGGRIRNPHAVWNGSAFTIAWDQQAPRKPGPAKANWPVEVVYTANVDTDGNVTTPTHVAGSLTEPAIRPTVASSGAGATIIAYEQHPAKGDQPITVSFRVFKTQ